MMMIGLPKEIKKQEYRVALTPAGCEMVVQQGQRVIVQRGQAKAAASPTRNMRPPGQVSPPTRPKYGPPRR